MKALYLGQEIPELATKKAWLQDAKTSTVNMRDWMNLQSSRSAEVSFRTETRGFKGEPRGPDMQNVSCI